MIATFVALPIALRDRAGIDVADHSKVYFGVLLASIIFTVPLVVIADRANRSRAVMLIGIILLGAALAGLAGVSADSVVLVVCMVVYFHRIQHAGGEPACDSCRGWPRCVHAAPPLGVYSTLQYLGAFAGGVVGGWLLGAGGERATLAACAGLVHRMDADCNRTARATATQRRAVANRRRRT